MIALSSAYPKQALNFSPLRIFPTSSDGIIFHLLPKGGTRDHSKLFSTLSLFQRPTYILLWGYTILIFKIYRPLPSFLPGFCFSLYGSSTRLLCPFQTFSPTLKTDSEWSFERITFPLQAWMPCWAHSKSASLRKSETCPPTVPHCHPSDFPFSTLPLPPIPLLFLSVLATSALSCQSHQVLQFLQSLQRFFCPECPLPFLYRTSCSPPLSDRPGPSRKVPPYSHYGSSPTFLL